ncbi:Tail-specific protease precursor [hydrothermal vent metagenome]|uniref:Tail-specific protease n=1 Tax=hydrothermal vent metagenome TaxID=652676 RepID=A0A3B1CQC2_9ZZZZ
MKKLLFILTLFLFTLNSFAQTAEQFAEQNAVIDTFKVLYPTKLQSKVDRIVTTLLSRYHYKKVDLDDSLSSIIFDNYIKTLDYNRMYFLQSDIDRFEKYRYNLDDYLKEGILYAPFEIFDTFKKRLTERMYYVVDRLKTNFDYSISETFIPNREKAEWAQTTGELDDIWRKRLKNDALNKKLSKEDWEKTSKTLTKRYQRFHKVILQYKAEDVFQIYMNAFASSIDPHTSYFSPITSENFDISMSLSFEGIGASLMVKDDYTTIARIIPGGPAAKSKNLFENDRIVAVGQGKNGEMVDVVGWRIDDVVKLIRGKKGTMVRLAVLRADATFDMPTEEVKLIRAKIKLEDKAASSKVINIEENGKNYKLGVIKIPAFYIDFEAQRKHDPDYRSTTRDVKKLITELEKEKVNGLIIDLRSDGGGSLQEAVQLTGLFIAEGPVVQVKSSDGKIEVDKDPDPSLFYDKPIAVLINRYSASASEIFAGAIQDYGRGIIVGEQSFGKGTVQNLIDLNRFMPTKDEDLGKLKITVAKFYRITGSSTQLLGVMPDVQFPSFPRDEFGEASEPSALPWDQIAPTEYQIYGDIEFDVPKLKEEHEKRIKDNFEFQYLKEDIKSYIIRKKKVEYSLNEKVRAKEREEFEKKKEERKKEREKYENLELKGKEEVKKPNIRIDDPLLEETGFIISDLMILEKKK